MGQGASNSYGLGGSSTAEQVIEATKPSLEGKNIVITGANTGIGKETARVFAKYGANVVIGCRDINAGKKAVDEIRQSTKNNNVEVYPLDLSSLESVRKFADTLNSKKLPIHILILNAGVMACPIGYTKEGYELQWGTNHLGHFYLTNLLIERLQQASSSRVVVLSSEGHRAASAPNMVEWSSGKSYDRYFGNWISYGNSKLSNVLFAKELARRYQDKGITAYSLHPGGIHTDLQRHIGGATAALFSFSRLIGPFIWKTIPQGAATSVYCAVTPGLEKENGKYFNNCNLATPSSYSTQENAEKLWKYSEELIQKFEGK